ncbi:hypothetical protein F2Q69_00018697 [Brassica cretica]|uniref:Uncharacterized protein n=1 Tax=Brassica cretica TaxID=69181 RepID=A0A8S9Q9V6_BRACR|nr:hypothetical protein F2Q69_00018697 [Brassica cretica]
MKLSWMVRGNLKRDRKQIEASKRFFTISVGGSSVPPSFVTDAAVGMSEPTST